MRVALVAGTKWIDAGAFNSAWSPTNDDADGDSLIEAAGRACYQSWDRPNPKTATNEGYIHHILDVKHLSVLEHASATFYVEGVSRSLTHELVRHRHFSYSQLSQRFVDGSNATYIIPPVIRGKLENGELDDDQILTEAMNYAAERYMDLVELLTEQYGLKRKQAREAARCVLPNMTETKIVVTGNYRAWRHFIDLRATAAADAEIRELALEILRQLQGVAPNVFGDYVVGIDANGVTVARSTRHVIDD